MGSVDSSSGSAFQALFGPELLRSDGTAAPTAELLAGKTAVGIYFSAHWCPPCRGFTPQLAERYKALLAANKELEIVFVSSDREEASFDDYFASMPWAALPFSARDIKAKLSSKFGVSGIPSLVFLDSDGSTITRDGRGSVMSDAYLDDFPFHPKPVLDLGNAGSALAEPVVIVLAEGADDGERHAIHQALETVSLEERAKSETGSAPVLGGFIIGAERGPLVKIRSVCGLPTAIKKHDHPLKHIPANSGTGRGWGCDGCGRSFSKDDRHRCAEGCDFDYCPTCNEKAGLSSETKLPVVLLILDAQENCFYLPNAEFSSEPLDIKQIRQLVSDFKAGKLSPKSFAEC